MSYAGYERRKDLQQVWAVLVVGLLASGVIALICWAGP
jgi:hypothetical protein